MKRIIAVNSNCYHGYTIEEAIAGIREAGFHYIELTATKGWTEHVFPDMSFERLLATGRRLMALIERSRGCANKDLGKFADQIAALCDKWEKY